MQRCKACNVILTEREIEAGIGKCTECFEIDTTEAQDALDAALEVGCLDLPDTTDLNWDWEDFNGR